MSAWLRVLELLVSGTLRYRIIDTIVIIDSKVVDTPHPVQQCSNPLIAELNPICRYYYELTIFSTLAG